MDFLELRQAVSQAAREKDYERFKVLIETFLATAQGEDYTNAVLLQADGIMLLDRHNPVQGLVLIDEVLPALAKSPVGRLRALITALGLCLLARDVERAQRYEEESYRLLLEHAGDPAVRAIRHRLQLNLGIVAAYVRLDYSTAYWHLAQAANSLTSPEVSDGERRLIESAIHTKTAMACLRVRRFYEAQEALDLAEQSARSEEDWLITRVLRIDLLRQLGATAEAQQLAGALADPISNCDLPDVVAEYYWTTALLAQEAGDLVRCHQLLTLARDIATEHRHDYLLPTIQRFLRTPTS